MQTQGQALVCDLTSSQEDLLGRLRQQALKMVVKDDCVTGEPPPLGWRSRKRPSKLVSAGLNPSSRRSVGSGKLHSVLREVRLYRRHLVQPPSKRR